MIRHLKTGKSPKEVAWTMKISWKSVQMIILRHRQVRTAYVETYSLRHPTRSNPPPKIVQPLAQNEL